jgi:DNA-binding SARP family transcriptional activator
MPFYGRSGSAILRDPARVGLSVPADRTIADALHRASDIWDSLIVSFFEGCIRSQGRKVDVSKRSLEVMAFLATRNRPCSSADIADAIWPDLSGQNLSIVRVYIRKLRQRLGNESIIATSGGYALGSAEVDLVRVENLIAQAYTTYPLPERLRIEFNQLLGDLSLEVPSVYGSWDWFAPIGVRVSDAQREVMTILGRDALQTGDPDRALVLGQQIINRDSCDEPARELRIRAFLARGDSSSARREFRLYTQALRVELDARPSPTLGRLIEMGRD